MLAKPDWETAPTWANWLAQDSDGQWWWYQTEPFIALDGKDDHWSPRRGSRMFYDFVGVCYNPWKTTLEHRR